MQQQHHYHQPQQQQQQQQQEVFVADEKFSDVIVVLERRGWHRSGYANSPNFRLKWRNLSNINFRLLRKDQFVNHVYNSQQLSNKALLAGHLAYRHVHHRRQQQLQARQQYSEGRGDPSNSCGHGDHSKVAGDLGVAAAAAAAATTTTTTTAENRPGFEAAVETEITNPEVFLPRCWDMSDDGDGVCSMLKAFAVSAAVALLRMAVKTEEEGRPNRNRRNYGSGGGRSGERGTSAVDATALAAATSLASRYFSVLLRSSATTKTSKSSSASIGRATSGPGPAADVLGIITCTGLTCCGKDAADAAVTLESPEFMSILTAWEAEKATEGSAVKDTKAEANTATEETAFSARPGRTESTFTRDGLAPEAPIGGGFERGNGESNPSTDKQLEEEEEEDRQGERGMASTLATAEEALRVLDEEADPQGALCLGEANAWVVKPAGLSCGRGVEVASSLRGLVAACRRLKWKAVVQKYVERPLLVQGYKFDIRQWVLLTSCNPLVVWGFDESYVRFSSRPFTMDDASLSDRLVHLCNHSVQKEQDQGVGPRQSPGQSAGGNYGGAATAAAAAAADAAAADGCSERSGGGDGSGRALPTGSRGNMWTADQLRNHLLERFQGNDVFREVVLPRIRSVVVETLLAVREGLEMKGRALEWLGFDLMITEDLRAMLIEVNVSPDVSHSTSVTARLVPAATEDALGLLLDDGKADERATAAPPPGRQLGTSMSPPGSEVPGPKPTSPSGPGAVEAREPARAGKREAGPEPPGLGACAGDGQEGESGLRWRLWHKGEKEPRAALGRLREEKKAWFEARRKNRPKPGGVLVENDRDKALSVVERIIESAAVADAPGPSAGNRDVPPLSGGPPPPPTGGALGWPLANDAAVSPSSVSRRIAHAESAPEGCGGCCRGKGDTVDEVRGAVRGLSMPGPEASRMTQDEEEDEL